MGDFGSVSWKDFDKFLLENGCVFKRIKGDHRIYWKDKLKRPLVVPQYSPLPAYIILNNLKVLGASREDFLKFLER